MAHEKTPDHAKDRPCILNCGTHYPELPFGLGDAAPTEEARRERRSAADAPTQRFAEAVRNFAGVPPKRFAALLPHREGIAELRQKGASFGMIRELLALAGIEVAADTVRRFYRE